MATNEESIDDNFETELELLNKEEEHKAKENPDPIFDLSGCDLKRIPNIYSLIKVFRKECLYLHNNKIKNLEEGGCLKDLLLLNILDVSRNKLERIPKNIGALQSLRVLKLDYNQLTHLPDELCCLSTLEELTVSSNKLKKLPDNLGNLCNLKVLDLRNNPIRILPSTIFKNKRLSTLLIDEDEKWINPPLSVITLGIDAILQHFSNVSGCDKSTSNTDNVDSYVQQEKVNSMNHIEKYDQMLQESLKILERSKSDSSMKKIESERIIFEQKTSELELIKQNEKLKHSLLQNVVKQQRKMDEKIMDIQKQKEVERRNFIVKLQLVENTIDDIIQQLLQVNAAQKEETNHSLLRTLFDDCSLNQPLQSTRVFDSMAELLNNECDLMNKLEENDMVRRNYINMSYLNDSEFGEKIEKILERRRVERTNLLEEITVDKELQCAALAVLVEKTDSRNIELQNQIELIQNQLSNLTVLELKNKDHNMNNNLNEISERRTILTEMLFDIFQQQKKHRNNLIHELIELEQIENKKCHQYWLMQYQKLLNSQSISSRSLNPSLVYQLVLQGVSHYSPTIAWLIADKNYSFSEITEDTLKVVGVHSKTDCIAIIEAFKCFLRNNSDDHSSILDTASSTSNTPTPSNPLKDEVDQDEKTMVPSPPNPSASLVDSVEVSGPSAPLAEIVDVNDSLKNECVVCMERESCVIYFPCGHLCNCLNCSLIINNCPLCRCDIQNKMQVYRA